MDKEFESLIARLKSLQLLDYEAAAKVHRDSRALVSAAIPGNSSHIDRLNHISFKPMGTFYNTGHHAYKDHWFLAAAQLHSVLDEAREEFRLISKNSGGNDSSDKWYKKPIGIIALSVISGITVLVVRHVFFL